MRFDSYYMSFAPETLVAKYRILNGYTQVELAYILGISTRQLQRIEKDFSRTKISTLRSIIRILDIPDNEIIKVIKGETIWLEMNL